MESLSAATAQALSASGREILREPKRFVAHVTDVIDTESPEARVLYLACNEELLACFAEGLESGTASELIDAAERATRYLNETFVIDLDVSRRVSFQIAYGCAEAAEIPDWREAMVAHVGSSTSFIPPKGAGQFGADQMVANGSDHAGHAYAAPEVAYSPEGTSPQQAQMPARADNSLNASAAGAPKVKKAESGGIGKFLLIVAAMFALFFFVAKYVDASDTSASTVPLIQEEVPEVELKSEGEVDGVGFWIEPRTDLFDGSESKSYYLFLYNNNSYTVSVTLAQSPDYVRALGPGEDGVIWCMDYDAIDPEDLHVKETDETSVAAYLSWAEQERSDGSLVIGVYNSSGSSQPFKYTLFLGPEYCRKVSWITDEQEDVTTIDESYEAYGFTDYESEPVFDDDYNIYVDGVMIPKH